MNYSAGAINDPGLTLYPGLQSPKEDDGLSFAPPARQGSSNLDNERKIYAEINVEGEHGSQGQKCPEIPHQLGVEHPALSTEAVASAVEARENCIQPVSPVFVAHISQDLSHTAVPRATVRYGPCMIGLSDVTEADANRSVIDGYEKRRPLDWEQGEIPSKGPLTRSEGSASCLFRSTEASGVELLNLLAKAPLAALEQYRERQPIYIKKHNVTADNQEYSLTGHSVRDASRNVKFCGQSCGRNEECLDCCAPDNQSCAVGRESKPLAFVGNSTLLKSPPVSYTEATSSAWRTNLTMDCSGESGRYDPLSEKELANRAGLLGSDQLDKQTSFSALEEPTPILLSSSTSSDAFEAVSLSSTDSSCNSFTEDERIILSSQAIARDPQILSSKSKFCSSQGSSYTKWTPGQTETVPSNASRTIDHQPLNSLSDLDTQSSTSRVVERSKPLLTADACSDSPESNSSDSDALSGSESASNVSLPKSKAEPSPPKHIDTSTKLSILKPIRDSLAPRLHHPDIIAQVIVFIQNFESSSSPHPISNILDQTPQAGFTGTLLDSLNLVIPILVPLLPNCRLITGLLELIMAYPPQDGSYLITGATSNGLTQGPTPCASSGTASVQAYAPVQGFAQSQNNHNPPNQSRDRSLLSSRHQLLPLSSHSAATLKAPISRPTVSSMPAYSMRATDATYPQTSSIVPPTEQLAVQGAPAMVPTPLQSSTSHPGSETLQRTPHLSCNYPQSQPMAQAEVATAAPPTELQKLKAHVSACIQVPPSGQAFLVVQGCLKELYYKYGGMLNHMHDQNDRLREQVRQQQQRLIQQQQMIERLQTTAANHGVDNTASGMPNDGLRTDEEVKRLQEALKSKTREAENYQGLASYWMNQYNLLQANAHLTPLNTSPSATGPSDSQSGSSYEAAIDLTVSSQPPAAQSVHQNLPRKRRWGEMYEWEKNYMPTTDKVENQDESASKKSTKKSKRQKTGSKAAQRTVAETPTNEPPKDEVARAQWELNKAREVKNAMLADQARMKEAKRQKEMALAREEAERLAGARREQQKPADERQEAERKKEEEAKRRTREEAERKEVEEAEQRKKEAKREYNRKYKEKKKAAEEAAEALKKAEEEAAQKAQQQEEYEEDEEDEPALAAELLHQMEVEQEKEKEMLAPTEHQAVDESSEESEEE